MVPVCVPSATVSLTAVTVTACGTLQLPVVKPIDDRNVSWLPAVGEVMPIVTLLEGALVRTSVYVAVAPPSVTFTAAGATVTPKLPAPAICSTPPEQDALAHPPPQA